jgi:uncharacterized membrane protein YuzA (DUF378 family)
MAGRINWKHTISVVSLTVLIGVEILVAGVAAGWAIAGLFGLGEIAAYVLEALGGLFALYMVWSFFQTARKAEPLTE